MKQPHFEVILEDINGKLDAVVESLQLLVTKVDRMDRRLSNVETEMKTFKSVLRVHNNELKELKSIHPNMRHAS